MRKFHSKTENPANSDAHLVLDSRQKFDVVELAKLAVCFDTHILHICQRELKDKLL